VQQRKHWRAEKFGFLSLWPLIPSWLLLVVRDYSWLFSFIIDHCWDLLSVMCPFCFYSFFEYWLFSLTILDYSWLCFIMIDSCWVLLSLVGSCWFLLIVWLLLICWVVEIENNNCERDWGFMKQNSYKWWLKYTLFIMKHVYCLP